MKEWRRMVKGKRVAVVGRAPSLIGQGHGAAIDSADVVVRVNHTEGEDPPHTGSRTDIAFHARKTKMPEGPYLRVPVSAKRRRKLGTDTYRPFTGTVLVWELLRIASAVHVYGFDFYRTQWDDLDPTRDSGHSEEREAQAMIRRGWAHEAERDRQMVRGWLGNPRFRPDPIMREALDG